MLFRRAADVVAVSHFTLVAFVVVGGFVARRHPRVTKAHVATLAATAAVYAAGFDCPLTDWEKGLRRLAGDEAYAGGYLEHYLISPFHPAGMNPVIGLAIVGVAVVATVTAYRDRLPGRSGISAGHHRVRGGAALRPAPQVECAGAPEQPVDGQ